MPMAMPMPAMAMPMPMAMPMAMPMPILCLLPMPCYDWLCRLWLCIMAFMPFMVGTSESAGGAAVFT